MLTCALGTQALAATTVSATASQTAAEPRSPRASLRLDIGRGKAWVGQTIPVTVTAFFRDVDGVTLEGAPQIGSSGLFTSELSREPRQSTQVIQGEPMLVATWTGTLTPISPASLEVSVQLPVHLRYHLAAPRVEASNPFDEDAFDALAANPFDPSVMNRFFNRAMSREAPVQRHEQDVSLRATGRPIEVVALPEKDQPASFTGAIGRFELAASLSSTRASVSEPVTLRVDVTGDGDLDRVDLAGVTTSDAWKAYPPKSSVEPATKGARARKVFEQVLVPLRGGTLSVPPVSLSAFDPQLGQYTTRETAALSVTVDGTGTPPGAGPSLPLKAASSATLSTPTPVMQPPMPPLRTAQPVTLAIRLAPVPLLVVAALVLARFRKTRAVRSLRRTMRVTARRGDAVPFYRAARTLIEGRLAERWGIRPAEVSPRAIEDHLGPDGEALAAAILADETLRFGRGRLERADLVGACSAIEQSLRGAS
jgi:hypothetical protein